MEGLSRGFELPDEIVNKHLGIPMKADPAPAATAGTPAPKTADKAKAPADEDTDKDPEDAGDPDDDALDAADPADDDDPDAEDPDEGDDDQDSDKEPVEDILEKVSADDLKRINEDPALQKAYKSMQRGFTQRMQGVSTREGAIVEREQALEEILTPDGMASYMAEVFESHPTVVGAAFEAAAVGENGEAFLVAIGRAHPERLEKAYERVQELLADPKELAAYDRDLKQESRDATLQRREEATRRQAFDDDFIERGSWLETEAQHLGIEAGADLIDLKDRLVKAVKIDRATGRIQLSKADVRKLVSDRKDELDRIEARVQKRLEGKKAGDSQDRAKRLAGKAQEPTKQPPRGTPRKAPTEVKAFTPPAGADPLRSFIEDRLGV